MASAEPAGAATRRAQVWETGTLIALVLSFVVMAGIIVVRGLHPGPVGLRAVFGAAAALAGAVLLFGFAQFGWLSSRIRKDEQEIRAANEEWKKLKTTASATNSPEEPPPGVSVAAILEQVGMIRGKMGEISDCLQTIENLIGRQA